jgi:hypothetical protein
MVRIPHMSLYVLECTYTDKWGPESKKALELTSWQPMGESTTSHSSIFEQGWHIPTACPHSTICKDINAHTVIIQGGYKELL